MAAGILIQWYDLICFAILCIAIFVALYMICCCKEHRRYQTLTGHEDQNIIGTSPPILYENLQGHPGEETASSSSSQLWTSCWRGIHPAWMLATRFVSFVVLCMFLTWDVLLYNCSIFVYYTEWTFTLLILYFAIGTIMSAYGCVLYYSNKAPYGNVINEEDSLPKDMKNGVCTRSEILKKAKTKGTMIKLQGQYHYEETVIQQRESFWNYLLQILYQTCAGAVILTDIVFWFIILPFSTNTHLRLNLLMGGMHSLNIILLLLDTSLNALPFPWRTGLAYFMLWSCCYVIFQWVIHACGFTWWPYPFLELSTPWAPLWYFCLALVHLPCYGIYWLLATLKISTFSRLFPQAFVKY